MIANPKIFFFHNPKAAGTAVAAQIKLSFREDQCCPNIENDAVGHRLNNGSYKRFKGFSLYHGHYGADIYNCIWDAHFPVTNFRHPVERVVSIYNYFRNSVNISDELLQSERYCAVRLAKSRNFHDFISDPDFDINVYIADYHSRQLTGSGWAMDTGGDLSDACRLVDRMPWFYVSEYPILSSRWASGAFGWGLDRLPVANETKVSTLGYVKSRDLDSKDRKIILEKNTRDLALFEYAVNILLKTRPCI